MSDQPESQAEHALPGAGAAETPEYKPGEVNVFLVKDVDQDGNVALGERISEAGSQQLPADLELWQSILGSYVEPPYDPLTMARMLEMSTRLKTLVRTFAFNTVGDGAEVGPRGRTLEGQLSEQDRTVLAEERLRAKPFLDEPNVFYDLGSCLNRVKVDFLVTGMGYLEVCRNLDGSFAAAYHCPSHTVRKLVTPMQVQQDGSIIGGGFVHIRGGRKVYYKMFGDTRIIDSRTGKVARKGLALQYRANELIDFTDYSPTNSYYGTPMWSAAMPAIAGSRYAADYNLNFFKNSATPRVVIVFENTQAGDKQMADIKKFLSSDQKGFMNAHRGLVLTAQGSPIPGAPAASVKVIPLSVGTQDDLSFGKYRVANDAELREAFGVCGLFLGEVDNVNRATAYVAAKITNTQQFAPAARAMEYRLTHTIGRLFNLKVGQFRLLRPKTTDDLEDAQILAVGVQGGALTPDDLRLRQGLPPFDQWWSRMPYTLAIALLQNGMAPEMQGVAATQAIKELQSLHRRYSNAGGQSSVEGEAGFG